MISETNEQGLRDIGNNLEYKRFANGEELTGSIQQVQSELFEPTALNFSGPTLPAPVASSPDAFSLPLRPDSDNNPRTGISAPSGAGLEYSIIDTDYGTVEGVFRSIETKGDLDLISQPEVLVANTASASIKAGTKLPYQTVDDKTFVNLVVSWKDVGVNMTLIPTIMDDYVKLDLAELNVSDRLKPVLSRGLELPVFSTRAQTGLVIVPNGQTLVIGGLSSRTITQSEQRIPLLGDLPIIGMPFRKRLNEAEITSLLIFVRPTIVDLRALSEEGTSALEFWRGRGNQWENATRIEAEIDRMKEGL